VERFRRRYGAQPVTGRPKKQKAAPVGEAETEPAEG
jgi:hypothetical protein